MKLKEYFAAVAHVLHEHHIEGEVFDAITEGEGPDGKPDRVLPQCEQAIAIVGQTLTNNKKLLGVFDNDAETPQSREKLVESEIAPKDMKRHLLKVRRDLSRFAPKSSGDEEKANRIAQFEWIVTRIITDLNKALGGFPELGGIFSKTEETAYRREFKDEPAGPSERAASPAAATNTQRATPSPATSTGTASAKPDLLPYPVKTSPELERLTQKAIEARTKSYKEQKAAIDALNEQLRKEGKIL